jgi:small subunit ribosomal protein S8
MVMTDPIADMLTRIRNANNARHESCEVPGSKIKAAIAQLLVEEGYIKGYDVIEDDKQGIIRIQLKYSADNSRIITGIKRISKPGLRVYARNSEVPRVLGGLGIAMISTSKGIMSDRQARKEHVGGEVVCYVW